MRLFSKSMISCGMRSGSTVPARWSGSGLEVRGTQLAMSENGKPICRALMPDGELRELPVH